MRIDSFYAYGNPTVWIDPDGNAAEPWFQGTVYRKTDIIRSVGTVDTGNDYADAVLAIVYSGENLLRKVVNTAILIPNAPTFAVSSVTGESFEKTEQDLFAASVTNPVTGTIGLLQRLSSLKYLRAFNKTTKVNRATELVPTSSMSRTVDISAEVAPPQKSNLPIEGKESIKWLQNMEASVGLAKTNPSKTIHIGDRENDIYEYYCRCRELDTFFISRVCVNRLANESTLGRSTPHVYLTIRNGARGR